VFEHACTLCHGGPGQSTPQAPVVRFHDVSVLQRVQVNAAPGVVPPIASTDGVHVDRRPAPEERAALIAYLGTL
jgi:hypothetical protein